MAAHLRNTSLKFRRASHFKFGYSCAFAAIMFSLAAVAARIDEDDAATGLVEGFGELHYLYRASENLYSGSQPASEEAFAQLKRLGIRTIVSVDGAQPDLELASTYGFTYVHIPIGYDGIPAGAAASMAKALRTNTGPFYIHCHHGRHRGPAMAAIAVQLDTGCDSDAGLDVMRNVGTSTEYAGLWRDVGAFSLATIAGMDPKLFEAVPVGDFVSEMAAIDRIWDRIKWCEESGWNTPANHPDVTPAHEALMLNERMRELARLDDTKEEEIRTGLRATEQIAMQLHDSLVDDDLPTANVSFATLKKSCKECHKNHRN